MSIFSNILSKIFPSNHPAVVATAPVGAAAPTPVTPVTPATPRVPAVEAKPTTPEIKAISEVDVEEILQQMEDKTSQELNWRTSIVDLMKLLGLDSSLPARKQLAAELNYRGDSNDSATMNIWLQKQVMSKLASNGGKVPAELM